MSTMNGLNHSTNVAPSFRIRFRTDVTAPEERLYWDELPRIEIERGPERFDFVTAFMLNYVDPMTCRMPLRVRFCCHDGAGSFDNYSCTIDMLKHADHSGENFYFSGRVHGNAPAGELSVLYPCNGYYETQNRKGWIQIGESGKVYYYREHA